MSLPNLSNVSDTIAKALQQMSDSVTNLDKAAVYVRDSQVRKEYTQTYPLANQYSQQALENCAYHVHSLGMLLTSFIVEQSKEVKKLDLQVKTLSDVSCPPLAKYNQIEITSVQD